MLAQMADDERNWEEAAATATQNKFDGLSLTGI
jgi:hypothetical protein